jgi:hypothetical protein
MSNLVQRTNGMVIPTKLHAAAENAAHSLADLLTTLRAESNLTEEREAGITKRIKDRIRLLSQWIGD